MEKFYLIDASVSGDYTWLGIVIVVGSVVSLAYYLRVIAVMWMGRLEVELPGLPAAGVKPVAGWSPEADLRAHRGGRGGDPSWRPRSSSPLADPLFDCGDVMALAVGPALNPPGRRVRVSAYQPVGYGHVIGSAARARFQLALELERLDAELYATAAIPTSVLDRACAGSPRPPTTPACGS